MSSLPCMRPDTPRWPPPRPHVVSAASEMAAPDRYCTCCAKPLKNNVAWLELDQRADTYHDFGGVPTDKSQGWFPFGMTCARKALVKARDALAKAEGRS